MIEVAVEKFGELTDRGVEALTPAGDWDKTGFSIRTWS